MDNLSSVMECEVPGKDEAKDAETHMVSAAAFVEGGIQESCDDTCSICLEGFSDSDPTTVTSCKHEFHLQCILEWCQRSSSCPMCWQSISLNDPASQELLEAVEREKSFRFTPSRNAAIFRHPSLGDFELQTSRNAAIFRHPSLGDFELQHLPAGINEAELQERIIQHLAAAAALGRTHQIARREGSRSHSSAHAFPHYLVFSGHSPESSVSSDEETESVAATEINPSVPFTSVNNIGTRHIPSPSHSNQNSASSSRPLVVPISGRGPSNENRNYVSQSSLLNQDRAGPSELQSFSDSWKSRFSSISMKYKDSISKNTKEWKDKLFSRSSSMADIGSEVKREVNAGIAIVSRMMERLESRDNDIAGHVPAASSVGSSSGSGPSNNSTDLPLNGNNSASVPASSVSN